VLLEKEVVEKGGEALYKEKQLVVYNQKVNNIVY